MSPVLICSSRIKNKIDMPHVELGNMTVPTSTVQVSLCRQQCGRKQSLIRDRRPVAEGPVVR